MATVAAAAAGAGAAAAAATANPRIFTEEVQTFAAGAPAQGQSYQAGLQTPDLMSYIDVSVFANQQRQQPVISPHLLAATALADDGSKRARESNPFQSSFENLAAGAAGAAKAVAVAVRPGKMKKEAPHDGTPGPPSIGPPSNLGKAKKKGRRASTAEMTEEARTASKRDRNRLAAVSNFGFTHLFPPSFISFTAGERLA